MINNKVLALKYRPQEFKDLIGQEVIAQTITNAIKINKTPNAYLLTGIRGVGKTTTARLIAKALNCLKNQDKNQKCSPQNFCSSCNEIVNSNHIDVLEMDAASKTGIDDIRELIENSKYSPTSAMYKIFIIDEVHMLSKQAFNGLLKTLEEPPPRLKFILATTEVRKIPVTILSRCQRFDLKRVDLEKLITHLKNIASKENGKISDNALRLISGASEGSVRDAISLLDRALITQNTNDKTEIQDSDVRKMLGLADKSQIIILFNEILKGEQKKAISRLKDLIQSGLDAKNFLNDILEILYLFNRRINLGPIEKDIVVSEVESKLIDENAKNLDTQDIGLFWQLTIKTIEDLKIVSNENLALEMYIMQLIHLKDITETENVDKEIVSENNIGAQNIQKEKTNEEIDIDKEKSVNPVTNQLKNTDQIKTSLREQPKLNDGKINKVKIKTFEDIVKLANQENEIELKYDLERNVKLVNFRNGTIDISFNEKLNKNFIKILTEKLYGWTGERWIISLNKKIGEKTIFEKKNDTKNNLISEAKKNEKIKMLLDTFDDADLVDVQKEDDK